MRSRSNGGVIGAFAYPNQNRANGVFFIHDAAIYNTGPNPIWPLSSGFIYSATGGTITIAAHNSNYKVHTFSSNSTFTIENGAAEIQILLVGGGGAGGRSQLGTTVADVQGAGGGGGGGVTVVNTFVSGPTTFTVEVGLGGEGITSTTGISVRNSGKPSKVTSTAGHSYSASGGGYGGSVVGAVLYSPSSGGSGGGAPGYYNTLGTYATKDGLSTYGNDGGSSISGLNTSPYVNGGGGGGATGPGYDANYSFNTSLASAGGPGYLWEPTGFYYGGGGGGGRSAFSPYTGRASGGSAGTYTHPNLYTGIGGYSTSTNGGQVGTVGLDGYGQGGGGSSGNVYASPIDFPGAAGGRGTVIFCYRYK